MNESGHKGTAVETAKVTILNIPAIKNGAELAKVAAIVIT
jgi:hypothetical protein